MGVTEYPSYRNIHNYFDAFNYQENQINQELIDNVITEFITAINNGNLVVIEHLLQNYDNILDYNFLVNLLETKGIDLENPNFL